MGGRGRQAPAARALRLISVRACACQALAFAAERSEANCLLGTGRGFNRQPARLTAPPLRAYDAVFEALFCHPPRRDAVLEALGPR